jgi:hypothetical protein
MHRFYFHLHECGSVVRDEEGRELPSFEEAFKEAVLAARELMAEDIRRGDLSLSSHIEITDSYGIGLASVPFREAVSLRDGDSPGNFRTGATSYG